MSTQTDTVTGGARDSESTKEDRLRAFKRLIAHPHLVAASLVVDESIRELDGTLLIFVCGPTGVGKTTLKNHVLRRSEERVPMLSLLARPPLYGSFNWREFLQSGIEILEQPPSGHMGIIGADNSGEHAHLGRPSKSWLSGSALKGRVDGDLRMSLEVALKQRRPAAVFIDDAHYLGRVYGKRQLRDQIDCLKSMAETTETVHVLIGSYELLNLYDVCVQSTARSCFIHFPRYGSTAEELSQFKAVLRTWQDLLPFKEATDLLLKQWEFCYERSLGCVGILHWMLARAVHAAIYADEKALSQKYLEQYALPETGCCMMMHEIYEAESELAHGSAPTELRQMLGMIPPSTFSREVSATTRRTTFRGRVRGPKPGRLESTQTVLY